jgi:hypothetical protein
MVIVKLQLSNALQAIKYPSLTEACKAIRQRGLFV